MDHFSRLINREAPVGVPDDLPNAYLFNVEMVAKWSKDIVPMLTIGNLYFSTLTEANLVFVEQSQHYSMVAGRFYQRSAHEIVHRQRRSNSIHRTCSIGNMHLSKKNLEDC